VPGTSWRKRRAIRLRPTPERALFGVALRSTPVGSLMAPARKQTRKQPRRRVRERVSEEDKIKIRQELKVLFDGLSKKLSKVTASKVCFGGVSFEDALQEVFLTLLEEGLDDLPASELQREAFVLARTARALSRNKRRERDRKKVIDREPPSEPVESELERILINDENRRIITLAWTALEGRELERALLVLLTSGVDKKDTKLLAKYLKCPVPRVTKAKARVIRLLQTIVAELRNSNGDSK
jgi:hypothetical protein